MVLIVGVVVTHKKKEKEKVILTLQNNLKDENDFRKTKQSNLETVLVGGVATTQKIQETYAF
jgi:hypothetical protein